MDTPMYLKPNVQLEPLVDQWYGWSHLIAPATAARNLTERHFKIMDSYISAPHIHANAVKIPQMLGGPFIDYEGKRVDEIRALRDETNRVRKNLVDLSSAISELDATLRSNAKGFSVSPLYEKVPDLLKGYVEIVYDLNNNPVVRFIEPLLYKSPYYDRSAQSLMLSFTKGDDRSFVLSTPRLEEKDSVHLRVPFDDEAVDELFKLRHAPKLWGEIQEMLNLTSDQSEVFHSFLTPEPPPKREPYTGDGVRWRYMGHACVLIETKNVSVLFDPVISYTYESATPRYTYQDLPDSIDYIVLTHNHLDHTLFETLLQIRNKVKTVIVPRNIPGSLQDPSMKLIFLNSGFKSVIEMGDMESLAFEGGEIIALPFLGEHSDLDIKSKMAYMVRIGKHSLVFAADSCNVEPDLYRHVQQILGNADTLFLGMECEGAPLTWVYGPLLTQRLGRGIDESRRLNGSDFGQALDLVRRFNFREAYVYAMGMEPWLKFLLGVQYTPTSRPIIESNKLVEECRNLGITSERLFGRKERFLD
ncbi:MAG: MBL fold metallo-hydrolase [Blastocatellia bacterium]